MNAVDMTLGLDCVTITCCESACGITFAVPATWHRERHRDHSWFYCPNGHRQHYPGKSDVERLRERAERAESNAQRERERAERQTRSAVALRGVVTRTKNRIAAGKCPCCKAKFADLKQHMDAEHPDYGGGPA